jgi:hypothetical protein
MARFRCVYSFGVLNIASFEHANRLLSLVVIHTSHGLHIPSITGLISEVLL